METDKKTSANGIRIPYINPNDMIDYFGGSQMDCCGYNYANRKSIEDKLKKEKERKQNGELH